MSDVSGSRNDWRRVRLDEICKIASGSTPSSGIASYWNGEIAWVTPTDLGKLEWPFWIEGSQRRISQTGFDSCRVELVPNGSIVMSSRAPIGHLGVAKLPVCMNQGCKAFIPSSAVDSGFLFFALRHAMPRLQALGSGATFAEVSKTQVAEFEIAIPKPEEQRRIAATLDAQLSAATCARAAVAAQLEAAEKVFDALINQEFQNPEVATAPAEKLGDLCRISTGGTPSRSEPAFFGDYMPWVTPGDFSGSIFVNTARQGLSEHGIEKGRGRIFPSGSVLLVCIGATLGKVAVAGRAVSANQQINALICGPRLLPEYLYFWLRTMRRQLKQDGESATLPIINQERLARYEIPLPSKIIQRTIADRLIHQMSGTHSMAHVIRNRFAALEALPSRLLASAFSVS